jgi:mannose-6-phosphate isomerase-like protein (cupin superfamily)
MKHHTIAALPVRIGAVGLNDASGIRARDEILLGFEGIGRVVVRDEDVAVVERDCVYADQDFFGARGW